MRKSGERSSERQRDINTLHDDGARIAPHLPLARWHIAR